MAIPNAGIVGAGTQAHPNLIRVEGQRAAGADGMARAIGQPLEGVDEVIVQCVDGRYQSFVNGTLVSSRAADGAANITVTLNENSRVLELHLEPAEKIVAVAAPAEGELDQTQIDQMKQDRARATQLLAAGKSLLAQRNHQEAAAKFSEATALDPLCLEAAYLLGEAREGLSQRRGACTAYRGYLVTATMIEEGKLTAPPETEPAQINAERREAARDKLRKLDREGKQLADIIERYIRDLEQLKPKVKSHPYTVERIDERLEQLKGFTLIP
jgi:tetratricopeptide (TPR) repeat protein